MQGLKAEIFVPDLELEEQAQEQPLNRSSDFLIPVRSYLVLDLVVPWIRSFLAGTVLDNPFHFLLLRVVRSLLRKDLPAGTEVVVRRSRRG